ncbi:hypothetical protein HK096_004325 [Nowakowskiella sp. JEL0078]|nr:hypothetical protein HK096_004325 [Nowakowskiella sp. JEL0078]
MSLPAYKVLRQPDAAAIPLSNPDEDWIWKGATIDLQDGFIHLSTINQVAGTLNRFFNDVDTVTILKFDSLPEAQLKWESPKHSETDDKYPHIYGGLSYPVVASAEHIILEKADGKWPQGLELEAKLK